jgi:hypothetical protein
MKIFQRSGSLHGNESRSWSTGKVRSDTSFDIPDLPQPMGNQDEFDLSLNDFIDLSSSNTEESLSWGEQTDSSRSWRGDRYYSMSWNYSDVSSFSWTGAGL